MAVAILEVTTSRSFFQNAKTRNAQWNYVVRVTGEAYPEAAIVTAILAVAPVFWEGLSRQSVKGTPRGGGIYDVELPYDIEVTNTAMPDPSVASPSPTSGPGGGSPSTTPTGPASDETPAGTNVSIEIGGKPPKLFHSRLTRFKSGLAGTVLRDFAGALGVDADGKVEGIEVPDPASVMTIDMKVDFVSWKYIKLLQSLMWHTNNDIFRRQPIESVAFMGASLKSNPEGRVDISFKFGLAQEETFDEITNHIRPPTALTPGIPGDGAPPAGRAVGSSATPFTKRGWNYVWVAYQTEVEDKVPAIRPQAMYVEKILPVTNFAQFGIGV